MSAEELMVTQVPDACTLPTAARPLRLTEWDELLTAAVLDAQRLTPTRARFRLRADPQLAARAADLAFRESQCCSFFEFSQIASGGELWMEITVPAQQLPVLDALVGQAAGGARLARAHPATDVAG